MDEIIPKTLDEGVFINRVSEYRFSFDTTDDDVLNRFRCSYARFSRHNTKRISTNERYINISRTYRILVSALR